MEDEDPIFDPSKKKKKKKKMPLELEAALTGETLEETPASAATEAPAPEVEPEEPEVAPSVPDANLEDDFGLLKKKKKKKKATFDMVEVEEALPTEEVAEEPEEDKEEIVGDGDMDFSFASKKKKKKKAILQSDLDRPHGETDVLVAENGCKQEGTAWSDTNRDYTYEELLKRVFSIMREKNPDMVAGEKKRFVMKPPQMMRVGTKKSSFSNFADICKLLHRQPKHLLAFLLAELGTSGSIDGNNQLIIKGRFQQKQIEHVLRAYIKEYVTCHTCRSPDTMLQKDTRLHFLQCETCGSRCSVASIKSGFQAVTGKRAALRAKTA